MTEARASAPDHDLRVPTLGAVAWAATLGGFWVPWLGLVGLGLAGLGSWWWRWRRGRPVLTTGTWLLVALGLATTTAVRAHVVAHNAVTDLARQGAVVEAVLDVRGDPQVRHGRFGEYVVLPVRTVEVVGRGRRHHLRVPVSVIGGREWAGVPLGARVATTGRLRPASTRDLSAVLSTRGPPRPVSGPAVWWRGAAGLRASVRAAVAHQPIAPRALVPGLVDGDDAGLPDAVVADFRTAGLTHLVAVSGTNLTLVVGFLLLLARWVGVRARGLTVVGALGIVGFVVLARAEPSVLRAAAMGSVALLGLGSGGRRRGIRALGAAVFGLLLLDPWLALTPGFALSTCATAGILWLAPSWRDRLCRWLPRWAAEALAVPLAGPATVLGLAGGVVGLLSDALGRVVAWPAAWCARWIIEVATTSAGLPVAAVSWPAGPAGLAAITFWCVVLGLFLGSVLARRSLTLLACAVLVVVLLVPLPTPGWPPKGWLMVACDVGQGDGLVLSAGPRTAVVVDAGPDPRAMDGCLRRLRVHAVPLVVLTHFHADHVDGLSGVLAGRQVGGIEVGTLADPVGGVRLVQGLAATAHVPVRRAAYGEVRQIGSLWWQVIGPSHPPAPDSDSPPNDASLVMLVETRGIRLLLMGDEESGSQAQLLSDTGGVRADVLKVAHHGSAKQDPDLVRSTGAGLAVISVGRHNDYGHPAPSTLSMLREDHMQVARTDEDGDVAVVLDGDGPGQGSLRVVRRGSAGR